MSLLHPAQQMAQHLAEYYSSPLDESDLPVWAQIVAEVVHGHVSQAKFAAIWPVLCETWLLEVEQVAVAHLDELQHLLTTCGSTAKFAKLLKGLARWQGTCDDAAELFSGDLSDLLTALRKAGCSRAWAERLLCRIGQRELFHIDRAAQRVVCRHGWLDQQSEYDEWQDWFVRGASEGTTLLAELSRWVEQVGDEHCGPQPHCTGCPLEPLLPAHGPCPEPVD